MLLKTQNKQQYLHAKVNMNKIFYVKKFLVQYFSIRMAKYYSATIRNYAYDSEMLAAAELYIWEFAAKVWRTEVGHSERYEFLIYRVRS